MVFHMSFNAPSSFFTECFTLSGFEQIRHVIKFDLLVDQLEDSLVSKLILKCLVTYDYSRELKSDTVTYSIFH